MNLGFGDASKAWPPPVGLLSPLLALTLKPRAQWDCDDWRKYAEHLEHAGYELARRFEQERRAGAHARAKLGRKKLREMPRLRGLLDTDFGTHSRPKRGRPNGSQVELLAKEALEMQARMKKDSPCKRITAEAAISEVRKSKGQRSYQPTQNRAVRNAMSRLKKSQKIL